MLLLNLVEKVFRSKIPMFPTRDFLGVSCKQRIKVAKTGFSPVELMPIKFKQNDLNLTVHQIHFGRSLTQAIRLHYGSSVYVSKTIRISAQQDHPPSKTTTTPAPKTQPNCLRRTRGQTDKDEVEQNFQLALEKHKRPKFDKPEPPYTSTPTTSTSARSPKIINFSSIEVTTETSSEQHSYASGTPDSDISVNDAEYKIEIELENFYDNTMTQNNPFATLKYAVEAVPYFDGQNIPLNYFIEGCEEAKSMLPKETEPQLTRIIRTRIIGEARRTIQDQNFDSVSQLTTYLKQIYGPTKNIYQLQGELGCIYQKGDENVVTYANRVKFLGKQILEAYKTAGNIAVDQSIKTSLEKDMNQCFIKGLKPEIEQRISKTLEVDVTVADALRIERELREMTELRQGTDHSGRQKNASSREICQICYKQGHVANDCRKYLQVSQTTNNRTDLGTDILICQICKKRGHTADKCRYRDPQVRRSVNIIQEKLITCQLCSKSGHNAKICQQGNVNNTTNRISIIWCEKPGHSANNCWRKQNENRHKISCQICNNYGHVAKDCRSSMNQQGKTGNSLFCRYCKDQGHLLENCQVRLTNNQKKNKAQGNYNGPSTSGAQQGPEQEKRPHKTQVVK
ncbi:LOW QUALITY PROTEIN: uncharacterized protein [Anoplolepis gracilipes]|uniref:LOW QUALITY PROTEIN: uncharacterized protein n=1 Tax=Anoplolepis gracilipes TaxID=354296 RepID=UPI003B9FB495